MSASAPIADAQTRLANLVGKSSGDEFGESAVFLGDIDGDGCDDLLVGSPRYDGSDENTGRYVIVSGGTGETLAKENGSRYWDLYGNAVASLGDVNDDGVPDYAVGAHKRDSNDLESNGTIYVYSGANHKKLYSIKGDEDDADLGERLAGVGDIDGDGFGDFLSGSSTYDVGKLASAGRVILFSGVDGSVLATFNGQISNGRMGDSVSAAGDVDFDGELDVYYGSYQGPGTSHGRIWIRAGDDFSLIHQIDGGLSGTKLGKSIAAVGDINKDGYDDVIAGGYQDDTAANNAGIAYVISGQTGANLFTPTGSASSDSFGWMVAGVGDINKDTFPDFMVGAPGWDGALGNMGHVDVYSGFDGSLLTQIQGTEESIQLGLSGCGGGDWDGDGRPDIAVGSSNDNEELGSNGMLIVYSHMNRESFVPGDRIEGSIGGVHSFREIVFDGVKDMKLKLTVSELVGTIEPRVTLFDPSGVAVWVEEFENSAEDQSANEVLDDDGPYRLRIDSLDGTTGSFALLTNRKDSDDMESLSEKEKDKDDDGETVTKLRALAGATVDMTIKGNKKWSKAPTVEITDRHGVELDISGVSTQSADTITITGLALPDCDAYRIVARGFPSSNKAKVTVKATITQPDLSGNTIVLP